MGLARASEQTFEEQFEADFLLILNEDEERQYRKLRSVKARKAFVVDYWRRKDPNPILPVNLALKEHLRRREHAKQNFPSPEPPYYDDRGKYYIKFGKPAVRHEDVGGFKYITFLGRNHPDAYYLVRANESWSYENVAHNFVVHFALEGQVFRQIESLKEIVTSQGDRSLLALQWNDIVKDRASVSPLLGETAMQVEELETALRLAKGSGRPGLLSSEVVMPSERIFEIVRDREIQLSKVASEAPPFAMEPLDSINQLPLQSRVAQFKADHDRTRVEITLYSPVSHYLDSRPNKQELLDVEYRCLFRNSNFSEVAEDVSQRTFSIQRAHLFGVDFVVGRLSFTVPPQVGDVTLQVRDANRERLGFSRSRFEVRDFRGPELLLSDLQFYTNVEVPRLAELLPSEELQGFKVSSYPTVEISKSKPLFCFFELYNPLIETGEEEFVVTYRIYAVTDDGKQRRESTSISYVQTVTEEILKELIKVDIGSLSPGQYEIEIEAQSKNVADLKAIVSRDLRVAR